MPPPDLETVAEAVFAALAEPTRRSILGALATHGPSTATDLAALLPISRQAITPSQASGAGSDTASTPPR